MEKRIKKPKIKPELRLEWLQRNEEKGESPPQIAARDGYDVRTVRKQIEQAKQDREIREARSTVLRNALESHYDDLRGYADTLNSKLMGGSNVEPSPDNEYLEDALHQHIPRSPLWNNRAKLENLRQQEEIQRQKLKLYIEQLAHSDPRVKSLADVGLKGMTLFIIAALVHFADQCSKENSELNLKDNLFTEPGEENYVRLVYFPFHTFDKVHIQDADKYQEMVKSILQDLESRLRESEEYRALEKTLQEIERLGRKQREELAIIRLRRIVPGKCKYCPI
jgi:hypothetical protein